MEPLTIPAVAPPCPAGQDAAPPKPYLRGVASGSTMVATFSSSMGNELTTDKSAGTDPVSFTTPNTDLGQTLVDKSAKLVAVPKAETHNTRPKPKDTSSAPAPPSHHPKRAKPVTFRAGPATRRVRYPRRTPNPPLGHLTVPKLPELPGLAELPGFAEWVRGTGPPPRKLPADFDISLVEGFQWPSLDELANSAAINKPLTFDQQTDSGEEQDPRAYYQLALPKDPAHPKETVAERKQRLIKEEKTRVFLHNNFSIFPPPDMAEHNRAFDQEVEKARVTHPTFDMRPIAAHLDRLAEENKAFAETMEENTLRVEQIRKFIESKYEILKDLQYEHFKKEDDLEALDEWHKKRVEEDGYQGPRPAIERVWQADLAKIVAKEQPVIQVIRNALRHLTENVEDGANTALNSLRWDFDMINALDAIPFREEKRRAAEEKYFGIGVSAAMMGLRGPQTEETANWVKQFAESAAKELAEQADQTDCTDLVSLAPNLDTIITTIPEWFTILDSKGTIELQATTPMDRFKELVQIIGRSSFAAKLEETVSEEQGDNKPFNKNYHEPDRDWPTAKQRVRGGWWLCRSGTDASPAELACTLCHPMGVPLRRSGQASGSSSAHSPTIMMDEYKYIMAEVDKAMEEANKKEQVLLKERMRKEHARLEEWRQFCQWRREAFQPHELLYGGVLKEPKFTELFSSSLPTSLPSTQSVPMLSLESPSDIKGKGKAVSTTSLPSLAPSADVKGKGKAVSNYQPPSVSADDDGEWEDQDLDQPGPSRPPNKNKGKGKAKAKAPSALATAGSKGKKKRVSWQL